MSPTIIVQLSERHEDGQGSLTSCSVVVVVVDCVVDFLVVVVDLVVTVDVVVDLIVVKDDVFGIVVVEDLSVVVITVAVVDVIDRMADVDEIGFEGVVTIYVEVVSTVDSSVAVVIVELSSDVKFGSEVSIISVLSCVTVSGMVVARSLLDSTLVD